MSGMFRRSSAVSGPGKLTVGGAQVPSLTKAMTVRFTESEFTTLTQWADASGKCPAEWLRDVALKNMAPGGMGMSREVIETRIGVNVVAELLVKAFPEKLPPEYVKKVVRRERQHVPDQTADAASGDGSAVLEAQH